MKREVLGKCPVCEEELYVSKLSCHNCHTHIEGDFSLCKFCKLTDEQKHFVGIFLKSRGNIKEIEKEMGISYPTVRGKLENVIEALEDNVEIQNRPNNRKPKWLKIKVFDPEEKAKVNVTLPISLLSIGANVGAKLASKFSPEFNEIGLTDNDMKEIFDIINSGEAGKIVDIDTEKGEKVEIIIE